MGKAKTYICEQCGKKFRSQIEGARFCCKACARRWRYGKSREKPCQYNRYVFCKDESCAGCGWNPQVAEERMRKYLSGDREMWQY